MAKPDRESAIIITLLTIERLTIAAGVVAAVAVLVQSYAHRPHPVPDPAAAVLAATSACDGATGMRAMLHAWLDGAELSGEPAAPSPPADDALRARGAQVYAARCVGCHGARGDGKGPNAPQLEDAPADLSAGVYQLRTTEHEALPTDTDLFRTITRGVHGTGMPPWFALPERDRWALVAYIKTLSKAFSDDTAPPPIEVHAPAVTAARLAHGGELFQTAGCVSCHGNEARGDGAAAAGLVNKNGSPERPRDLRFGRYHRGSRVEDVYLTLTTGLDGTPMASFARVLQPDDLWDLAMYVHSIAESVADKQGLRCRTYPSAPEADELVGIRTLVGSLPPTR